KSVLRVQPPTNFSNVEAVKIVVDRNVSRYQHSKNIWHCARFFKVSLSFLDHYWRRPSSWTLSGSCPLCLTPPCYHLRAAGNGGSFFVPIWVKSKQLYRNLNYIAVWTEAARARHAYPIVYGARFCSACSEASRHVRKVVERIPAGIVRR